MSSTIAALERDPFKEGYVVSVPGADGKLLLLASDNMRDTREYEFVFRMLCYFQSKSCAERMSRLLSQQNNCVAIVSPITLDSVIEASKQRQVPVHGLVCYWGEGVDDSALFFTR